MNCKKLTIETNGTMLGTTIKADGKLIGSIQRLELSAEVKNMYVNLLVEVARKKDEREILRDEDGNVKGSVLQTKKVKVRDEKTQKFIEKEEVVVEPLRIEFTR